MGTVEIRPDVDDPYRMAGEEGFWEKGDPDPAYYILADQMNHERSCYAEIYGDDSFNPDWLRSVMATLRKLDGWELAISNIPHSYVLIFGNWLLVRGRKIVGCRSASEVVAAVCRLFDGRDKRWWQFWK